MLIKFSVCSRGDRKLRVSPCAQQVRAFVNVAACEYMCVCVCVYLTIHESSGGRILEGLMLHHMTPMTGAISHREEDRFILLHRSSERLFTPRIPVH
jgi:hypothetical protein